MQLGAAHGRIPVIRPGGQKTTSAWLPSIWPVWSDPAELHMPAGPTTTPTPLLARTTVPAAGAPRRAWWSLSVTVPMGSDQSGLTVLSLPWSLDAALPFWISRTSLWVRVHHCDAAN